MGTSIERRTKTTSLSLNTATGTTAKLPYGVYSGGTIMIPNGSSITSLTYYAYDNDNGTYHALYDTTVTTPVAVVQAGLAADRAYPIRDEAYGVRTLVLVADAAGTVQVDLKG